MTEPIPPQPTPASHWEAAPTGALRVALAALAGFALVFGVPTAMTGRVWALGVAALVIGALLRPNPLFVAWLITGAAAAAHLFTAPDAGVALATHPLDATGFATRFGVDALATTLPGPTAMALSAPHTDALVLGAAVALGAAIRRRGWAATVCAISVMGAALWHVADAQMRPPLRVLLRPDAPATQGVSSRGDTALLPQPAIIQVTSVAEPLSLVTRFQPLRPGALPLTSPMALPSTTPTLVWPGPSETRLWAGPVAPHAPYASRVRGVEAPAVDLSWPGAGGAQYRAWQVSGAGPTADPEGRFSLCFAPDCPPLESPAAHISRAANGDLMATNAGPSAPSPIVLSPDRVFTVGGTPVTVRGTLPDGSRPARSMQPTPNGAPGLWLRIERAEDDRRAPLLAFTPDLVAYTDGARVSLEPWVDTSAASTTLTLAVGDEVAPLSREHAVSLGGRWWQLGPAIEGGFVSVATARRAPPAALVGFGLLLLVGSATAARRKGTR